MNSPGFTNEERDIAWSVWPFWAAAFAGTAILYNPLFALSGSGNLVPGIATLALAAASLVVPKPRLIPATVQN